MRGEKHKKCGRMCRGDVRVTMRPFVSGTHRCLWRDRWCLSPVFTMRSLLPFFLLQLYLPRRVLFLWCNCVCMHNSNSKQACDWNAKSVLAMTSHIYTGKHTVLLFVSSCEQRTPEHQHQHQQNRKFVAALSGSPKFWPFCSWNHGDHQHRDTEQTSPAGTRQEGGRPLKLNISLATPSSCWLTLSQCRSVVFSIRQGMGLGCQCSLWSVM